MSKNYVVRGYRWGYNDETFYPEGGFIHDVYPDKESADAALVKLERRHWSEMNLHETDVLFDGDPKVIAELNSFLGKKLGVKLDDSDSDYEFFVPKELSDEDFITFLDIAKIHAYKIIESDGESEFFAIWLPDDEAYLTVGDEEAVVFGVSIEQLKSELKEDPWALTHLAEDSELLEGKLEDISSAPNMLKELIASNKGASYKDGRIYLDEEDVDLHVAINEMLKVPMFQFKTISVDELRGEY